MSTKTDGPGAAAADDTPEREVETSDEAIARSKARGAEIDERIERLSKASARAKPKPPPIGAMF